MQPRGVCDFKTVMCKYVLDLCHVQGKKKRGILYIGWGSDVNPGIALLVLFLSALELIQQIHLVSKDLL